MPLTDDEYILEIGSWTRVMSRSESRARLKAGYEKKSREEPGWQKIARSKVEIEWSVEDRKEQSERSKAVWQRPEMEQKKAAARERLLAWRAQHKNSQEHRDATSERMLLGGSKKAVAARQIMQKEAVAARRERDANIVRNYYMGGMKVGDIAKLYGLEISWVYRILRNVPMD
jgi:hypothetical protein